ncbi:hypothetical protein QL285_070612 [Trifolium repens]|nr:hypothetical protein QL285_070612 [Trifolium repens]
MLSSNPLFSCIVTICTLIFLYLPHLFSTIVLSPVITLTGILLLTILRLGAIQKYHHELEKENQHKHESIVGEENRASKCREEKEKEKQSSPCCVESNEIEVNSEMGFESSSCFVEWNVRAPLEVIYEEYEEDEEKCDDSNEKEENSNMDISNYSSLSRYYPESDSDSSSEGGSPAIEDWDSPEEWDEEDREGLIEIALEGNNMVKKKELEFQYEEENLIEIDISPTRYKEFSGHRETLTGEISCN